VVVVVVVFSAPRTSLLAPLPSERCRVGIAHYIYMHYRTFDP
jgi:hypothetical protein